jgi:phosphoribosylamine---glycine ligase
MKILIIGSGGREHALAWKIAQSPRCDALFIAPGNAGTASLGTNLALDPSDFAALRALIDEHQIDLLLVGPERPLVKGITDYFADHSVKVIGPSQAAAQLEGSKDFAKRFMRAHGIPTARYMSFSQADLPQATAYLAEQPLPVVIKASGLAAGKGVLICQEHREAELAMREMLSGVSFGAAGETVVIEEFLPGIEMSVFVLTDGKDYVLLPSAKDYKRIGEGDTGLNTGGMGAVSPVPFAHDQFMSEVERDIVQPTMRGIQAEGLDFKGFIFIGLMVVKGKPYVLEYNVRMGDPEAEVVMPRLKSDLVDLLEAVAEGRLGDQSVEVDPRACSTVMLVSGGYPGSYETGKPIRGLEPLTDVHIFHAGTTQRGQAVITSGGRVLAVSAFGDSIGAAVQRSLRGAEQIDFEGKYFRRDIGQDLSSH